MHVVSHHVSKAKIKLSLTLNKHHDMMTYGGVDS
jgi:hypothetical protein